MEEEVEEVADPGLVAEALLPDVAAPLRPTPPCARIARTPAADPALKPPAPRAPPEVPAPAAARKQFSPRNSRVAST